ncbi:MAG TPA: hypothetical protein ENF48_07685 [Desulfobacteraceae bacterium]|nr:hypothetical protein [Deltaproteobacteria bacterium]MBW2355645.1 hypothetical protein [Deltaproteobacteria bacterium]RLB96161.1 MAG: hypothetical protein DRH76_07110 [Deltaproteobacteria bacterium]HDI60215.1 hypothetical protein [Desulfobacteraceae bacterium]
MGVREADLKARRAGAWRKVALALAGLALVGGCAVGRQPAAGTEEASVPARIALAPFIDMARVYGEVQSVRSPLTGKMFVTGEMAPDVADLLTAETERFLHDQGFEVVSPEAVGSVMETLSAGSDQPPGERGLIMATARQVEAEAILVGYLYRVHGRQGGRFAVRQPASVAFGLYLVHSPSGRMLWSGAFDETQRSLTEDLFAVGEFIRRRGEWVSATRMAVDGVRGILADFPASPGGAETADTL